MTRQKCPNCAKELAQVQGKAGVFWNCGTCHGCTVGVGLLQKISNPQLVSKLWMRARELNRRVGKNCPSCQRSMLALPTGAELGQVQLDVCASCYLIWFDADEIQKLPRATEAEVAKREREAARERPSLLPEVSTWDGSIDENDFLIDLLDVLVSWFPDFD